MRAAPSNVPDDLKWLEAVCAAVPPSHVPASNHVVLTFPSNQWELDPKQLAPIRKHPIYVEQRYDGLKVGAQTETGEEMDWDWEEQELNVMMVSHHFGWPKP